MRKLAALLLFVIALPLVAGSRSSITIVNDSDGESFASWERNGVRYTTRDPRVLEELEEAFAEHRAIGRDHAALGRRHAELGREHARLGREHARLGREHARLARSSDSEERQREFEELQRKFEREQEKLERKQRDLEREQRDLERKQNAVQRDTDKKVEEIFARAVREGRAKRD